jgi:hypothetical protein
MIDTALQAESFGMSSLEQVRPAILDLDQLGFVGAAVSRQVLVCAKRTFGLNLLPFWSALALRVSYLDQPVGEHLIFGMPEIRVLGPKPGQSTSQVFVLRRESNGDLILGAQEAETHSQWAAINGMTVRFLLNSSLEDL